MAFLFLITTFLNAACPLWSTSTSGWPGGAKVSWNNKSWQVKQGGNAGISPEDPNRGDWSNYFTEIQDTCAVVVSSSSQPTSITYNTTASPRGGMYDWANTHVEATNVCAQRNPHAHEGVITATVVKHMPTRAQTYTKWEWAGCCQRHRTLAMCPKCQTQ